MVRTERVGRRQTSTAVVTASGIVVSTFARRRLGAESLVLGERGHSGEGLAASVTSNLQSAIGVHTLVATQVRELGVRLGAHLATERFHRGVNVRVLLQAGTGCKSFAALGTGMGAGTKMLRADVALEVRLVGE